MYKNNKVFIRKTIIGNGKKSIIICPFCEKNIEKEKDRAYIQNLNGKMVGLCKHCKSYMRIVNLISDY